MSPKVDKQAGAPQDQQAWHVEKTDEFDRWLAGLADPVGRRAVVRRLARLAATGHIGDHRPVGEGVSELRVDTGPGYRVYYVLRGRRVVILLCGGDKGSQARDIRRAHALAAGLP